jgi:hypothetical protein
VALQSQNGAVGPPDFDFNTALGVITTIGAGIFGFIKWLERRNRNNRTALVTREEWLIDNAFDIVKELREEVTRLRAQLADERAEHDRRMRDMDEMLKSAQVKAAELERALMGKGD